MKSSFYRDLRKTNYNGKERAQFIKDIKELLDSFGYILNFLIEEKISVSQHRTLSSILINKFILHSYTILRLISGTEIKSKQMKTSRTVYDIGSIVILTRSAIENYLTFFYLYIQPLTEEEELFRYHLYELAGLYSLQWLNPIEPDQIKTKNEDKKRISELEDIVFNHPLFLILDGKTKNYIKVKKQAKLYTWWSLLEQADLNMEIFKVAWSLYSNYAHSEYISQRQLVGYFIETERAKSKCDIILNIIFCLTAIFVKDFTEFLPIVKDRYKTLDRDMLEVIDFFNGVGRKV